MYPQPTAKENSRRNLLPQFLFLKLSIQPWTDNHSCSRSLNALVINPVAKDYWFKVTYVILLILPSLHPMVSMSRVLPTEIPLAYSQINTIFL